MKKKQAQTRQKVLSQLANDILTTDPGNNEVQQQEQVAAMAARSIERHNQANKRAAFDKMRVPRGSEQIE